MIKQLIRSAPALCVLATLTACGSRPLPQAATVTSSRDAMSLGMQAYADNRYLEARNYFERALIQYRSVDDRNGQLDALVDLADSALGQGEYAAARTYLANAGSILVSGTFTTVAPHVALLRAYADLQAGDSAGAAARLDKLLADSKLPADIRQAALFARVQTTFDLDAADSDQWLDKLGSSLSKHADAISTARYQRLQALAARKHGDLQTATALYQNALDGYRKNYYRPGIAATLEEWADISVVQQDWPAAHDRLHRALDIRLWMYDRTHSAKDLETLSVVDAKLGNTAAAKQDAELADYLKNGGSPDQLPERIR